MVNNEIESMWKKAALG